MKIMFGMALVSLVLAGCGGMPRVPGGVTARICPPSLSAEINKCRNPDLGPLRQKASSDDYNLIRAEWLACARALESVKEAHARCVESIEND